MIRWSFFAGVLTFAVENLMLHNQEQKVFEKSSILNRQYNMYAENL